jgi:hypothetical protein
MIFRIGSHGRSRLGWEDEARRDSTVVTIRVGDRSVDERRTWSASFDDDRAARAAADAMESVQGWFQARGFRVELGEDAEEHWADRVSLSTEKVVAPRYGVTESAAGAAARAKDRFEQEQ